MATMVDISGVADDIHVKKEEIQHNPVLTPPASEGNEKTVDYSSDLSDPGVEEEDIGDVEPAYYYEGGKIPVFEPTMNQFKDFRKFIAKIDKYGMRSGIVKIVPPKEWKDSLPQLDEQVKTIRVRNPITQEFHGTHGTYTQANMEKQRSYNLPQWKALCEESNHQPPAKRGERRRNQEKVVRTAAPKGTPTRVTRTTRNNSTSEVAEPEVPRKTATPRSKGKAKTKSKGRATPRRTSKRTAAKQETDEVEQDENADNADEADIVAPPTPTSPALKSRKTTKQAGSDNEGTPTKSHGRQPKSVTSRRKNNRNEQVDVIDEEAFKGFDYRVDNQDEWTAERCQELETAYWKGLTFNNPMYGADMPGSLFDDRTTCWNVAKLPNLLDVLGQKVPGVNTAYLYLGMWKATFAWHLEDVDLYSINYIHFGAPKQWYSISQADARRFEAAMKNVWPTDAKNCDQFLRHKTYLISPQILKTQYNIEVNRLVHNEGEFVITYPYGYHSGYNLGYNCAESVNFATEEWLEYGRIAKKCNCEADSVWIDVWDIERKLRGEPTPEYYEETDYDDEEPIDLPPTPPASETGKRSRKRKRDVKEKITKPKKIRLRLKTAPADQPCLLCPNDHHFDELLPADNDKGRVHRRCAEYLPETWVSEGKDLTIACGINNIGKARYDLRCHYCKAKHGASFQCSFKKCTRAYHATCAFAAGVQIDQGLISVYDENGTEYADSAFDFRCRFHRHKRPKYSDRQACSQALEDNALIRKSANKLQKGDIIQWQYWQSDIFAGLVIENRPSERMLLVESIPAGYHMEVEHKWVLFLDKAHSHLQPPSDAAKPLPAHLQHKNCATEDPVNEVPKVDDAFFDSSSPHVIAEFMTYKPTALAAPKVDFGKDKQLWYYLGKQSTDAKQYYTADPANEEHDPQSNFLDSVKPRVPPGYLESRKQILPPAHPAMYGKTRMPQTLPPTPTKPFAISSHTNDPVKAVQQEKNRGIFIGSSNSMQNLTPSNNPWRSGATTSNASFSSSPALPATTLQHTAISGHTGAVSTASIPSVSAITATTATTTKTATLPPIQPAPFKASPLPQLAPYQHPRAPNQQIFRFKEQQGYRTPAANKSSASKAAHSSGVQAQTQAISRPTVHAQELAADQRQHHTLQNPSSGNANNNNNSSTQGPTPIAEKGPIQSSATAPVSEIGASTQQESGNPLVTTHSDDGKKGQHQ